MPNDNEDEVAVDAEEPSEETTQETPVEKPKETPTAKKARLERQLKQVRKQLGESDEEPAPSKTKSSELDYGQMALLRADGIKGSDELALVREYMSSGKQLLDIMENKHFLNDLADLRETKATKLATPSNSKRSTQGASTEIAYWVAKGGLPENTPANTELRNQIVAERIRAATDGNKFANVGIQQ